MLKLLRNSVILLITSSALGACVRRDLADQPNGSWQFALLERQYAAEVDSVKAVLTRLLERKGITVRSTKEDEILAEHLMVQANNPPSSIAAKLHVAIRGHEGKTSVVYRIDAKNPRPQPQDRRLDEFVYGLDTEVHRMLRR